MSNPLEEMLLDISYDICAPVDLLRSLSTNSRLHNNKYAVVVTSHGLDLDLSHTHDTSRLYAQDTATPFLDNVAPLDLTCRPRLEMQALLCAFSYLHQASHSSRHSLPKNKIHTANLLAINGKASGSAKLYSKNPHDTAYLVC